MTNSNINNNLTTINEAMATMITPMIVATIAVSLPLVQHNFTVHVFLLVDEPCSAKRA